MREPTAALRIDPSVYVAATAILQGEVDIGRLASIWYGAVLDGTAGPVLVGAGSSVQDRAVARAVDGRGVWIGDDVTVGHSALLLGCRIESRATIGLNAVVLPGAVVGSGALVAAGAVVAADTQVPAGVLVAGSPAVVKKALSGRSLEWAEKAALDYQRLSRRYLARRLQR